MATFLKIEANVKAALTGLDSYAQRLRAKAIPLVLAPLANDMGKEIKARIMNADVTTTGGYDVEGRPIKSNAPATIKRKLRLGHTVNGKVKSLVDTGRMIREPFNVRFTSEPPSVTISIPKDRLSVLKYLAEKGYKNFFGIPITINGQPIGDRARYYMRLWNNDAMRHQAGLRKAGYGE